MPSPCISTQTHRAYQTPTVLPRPRSWITDLKRVKLADYEVAITELEVEWNLLFRAKRYLEQARAG